GPGALAPARRRHRAAWRRPPAGASRTRSRHPVLDDAVDLSALPPGGGAHARSPAGARLFELPEPASVPQALAPPRAPPPGRARHVVAPSLDSLELARRAVGGFRVGVRARVVYNGVDVARIVRESEGQAPETLRAHEALRVGMVGNLDWRKNPGLLVEAAPAIRDAVPGVQVVLVGAFPDRGSEEALRARVAALGLEGRVLVTGFLPNPFPVVRALDVLVHPALRDPFPLALLEGMALGRPIVASAVGGIPEMLADGESGLLVPP